MYIQIKKATSTEFWNSVFTIFKVHRGTNFLSYKLAPSNSHGSVQFPGSTDAFKMVFEDLNVSWSLTVPHSLPCFHGKLMKKSLCLMPKFYAKKGAWRKVYINPFSTNVPLMDKTGNWILLAKCLKNTCRRLIF